jgi:hypothetical protein
MCSEVTNGKDNSTASQIESRLYRIFPESVRPYASTILKWAVAGYFIRIAIMPLFAHEDVIMNALQSFTLLEKHQMYTFYPPLTYLLFASVYALFSPFLPAIFANEFSSNAVYWPVQLIQILHVSQPGIQTFIFVSKIPMLIFDFALAFLLLHMINDGKKAMLAFKLWMLCPISIFISYFSGQFDVIPTFFMMLGLYFFKTHRIKWSMFSLGLCAAFKTLGLLFVPALALIYVGEHKNLTSKVKYVFSTFGISILPLFISKIASLMIPIYYESANVALLGKFEFTGFWGNIYYCRSEVVNPLLTELSLFPFSSESGVTGISPYLFPAVYSLFLFWVFYWKKWSVEGMFLIPLLAFYLFTPFHPQWFFWILPLLVLMAAEHRGWFFKLYLFFIPLYFVSSIFAQNVHFTSNLLSPTILQAYYWPGPIDLMNSVGIPGYKIIDAFYSIFSATFLMYLILVLRTRNGNS